MGSKTTTVSPSDPTASKDVVSEKTGLLGTLDRQIVRHQSAISLATAILAILGLGAISLGLARVSPALSVLSPF
jgi:hypothetical protein